MKNAGKTKGECANKWPLRVILAHGFLCAIQEAETVASAEQGDLRPELIGYLSGNSDLRAIILAHPKDAKKAISDLPRYHYVVSEFIHLLCSDATIAQLEAF